MLQPGSNKSIKRNNAQLQAYWLAGFKNKQGTWKPSLEEVLGTLQACKADGLDSQHTIPQEFCRAVLRAGLEWHAWTINDVKTAKRLAKRGIYSITTDRPKLIGSGLNN